MGFVEDDDDGVSTTSRLVAGDFLDFQGVEGRGNVVLGGVVWSRFRGVVVEHIRC